jgi:hypothetical protein
MMRLIEANSSSIIEKWYSLFDDISYYC